MKDKVYKIFTETEWNAFQKSGQFEGSDDDLRDSFIHLSTKEQIDGVIERFFSDRGPLYVAGFSDPGFRQRLKWETVDSGEVYPHLYGSELLLTSEVTSIAKLQIAKD